MNELTDVPIDRIPLSSLPGNLPPPRPPAPASAPPPPLPKSEPAAEPAAPTPPPVPQPRWVREALRDLVKLNRKKGIALSAAGSLVTAALAMNALFSGASREPEKSAAAQPVAQAAPPKPETQPAPQRDVAPPEPAARAVPPAEAATQRRTSATGLPTVEVASIAPPAPPSDVQKKHEQVAAALNIPSPAVVVAAPDPTKPLPPAAEAAPGPIQIPGVVPAAASEPAPASPTGGVVVAATLPNTAAPKPTTTGGDVKIPPPPDLTNPVVPSISAPNPAAGGVKPPAVPTAPTVEPVGTAPPKLPAPAPIVTETNTKPIAVPDIGGAKVNVPGATGANTKLDPPTLNIGGTTPALPTPILDDKKNSLAAPPIGDVKTSPAVPAFREIKHEPAANGNPSPKPEATVPGRAAALAPPGVLNPPAPKPEPPAIPPPAPNVETARTPVDLPKPKPPAASPLVEMNESPKSNVPAPKPAAEPFRLTKQAEPTDVRQTDAKSLPPARTSFDVDIHYPKAGETYSSLSKLHYGDARYAAALQSFNQGRALDRGDSVQIPPLYVLRQRATPGAPPAARPTGSGLEWASSGPATTAPTYSVPRDGMTMWDVAGELYGDRQKWGKVWDVNQRIEPNAQLPKGTKLQLPPDARQ
jgi:hypothetical protein